MADVDALLLQAVQPRPATCGFGSCIAATTRRRPRQSALRSTAAYAHDGCRAQA
jgi:hypothetical protein